MTVYKVRDFTDVVYVRGLAKRLAADMGFPGPQRTQVAIAVSELATNIVKYAGSGEVSIERDGDALVIEARDNGPGIKDVEKAFRDHWSDEKCIIGDDFLKHGSLGTGLPAVRRLMDSCDVKTSPAGTTIRAEKRLRPDGRYPHMGQAESDRAFEESMRTKQAGGCTV